jgi:hypothetical protein
MRTLILKNPKETIFALLAFMLIFNYQGSCGQSNEAELIEESDSLAQENESWNRFTVNFGGFFSAYNSGIAFRSQQVGLGVIIDIEAALGLETTVFALRGEASYKIGKTKKHYLNAGYFGINRNASKTLDEQVEVGGIIYPIGTKVTSKLNLSIIRVKYGYSFYQDDRVSIGASIGFFIMPVAFTIRAQGQEDHNTNFTAPLPLIGLRTDFQITKKFYLKQNVEVLYIATSSFSGGILDLAVFLEHKTFKNVAFAIGVNSNRLNVKLKKPDSSIAFYGDIRMDYTGALLYVSYYF